MNITEAVKQACKEPTLLDALSWICVWESERVVKQAKKNLRDADGKGWDTCFKFCLREVMEEYNCPKRKFMETTEARNFLVELMGKERVFDNYIKTKLAGDFVVKLQQIFERQHNQTLELIACHGSEEKMEKMEKWLKLTTASDSQTAKDLLLALRKKDLKKNRKEAEGNAIDNILVYIFILIIGVALGYAWCFLALTK